MFRDGSPNDLLTQACRVQAADLWRGEARVFDLGPTLGELESTRSELGELGTFLRGVAGPLALASSGLTDLAVRGGAVLLSQQEVLQQLDTIDLPEQMDLLARSLHDARRSVLEPVLEVFWQEQAAGVSDGEAGIDGPPVELRSALRGRRLLGRQRLAQSRQVLAPRPLAEWRGVLRPLLESCGEAVGLSIGVTTGRCAWAPASFFAAHPRETDRWTVFTRPSMAMGVARAFAASLGRILAHVCADTDDGPRWAGVLMARLGRRELWRQAGLAPGAARDAACDGGYSLLRLVARLWAYTMADSLEARALAAAAGDLMSETDDVVAALRWRGPWPDSLLPPVLRDRTALGGLVAQVLAGVADDAALSADLGPDWHRTPEAYEALLERCATPPGNGVSALLALLEP